MIRAINGKIIEEHIDYKALYFDALAVIAKLEAIIGQLQERVADLEKKQKIKTTSRNSSMPPSTDITRSTKKSHRGKSGRKAGGQSGRKGKTLKMSDNPDVIVDHKVDSCSKCGHAGHELHHTLIGSHQVYDIPKIQMQVVQHDYYQSECMFCNNQNAVQRAHPMTNASYGNNISNLIIYLSVRHFMPVKRLSELVQVFTGHEISTGTIMNMIAHKASKAKSVYEDLRSQIAKATVVGSDESSCAVLGSKWWLWVFQNCMTTFFAMSSSRSYQVVECLFPDGFKQAVMVSDCYAGQLKIPSKDKQICLAHLLRDAQKLVDHHQSKWAQQIICVLRDIFTACRKSRISIDEKHELEVRLDALVKRQLLQSDKAVQLLRDRLQKHHYILTTCLWNRKVPPDNNASERAIRNIKIKQKVSGCFRSKNGADNYAILRSIIDTAIKRTLHPFHALSNPQLLMV